MLWFWTRCCGSRGFWRWKIRSTAGMASWFERLFSIYPGVRRERWSRWRSGCQIDSPRDQVAEREEPRTSKASEELPTAELTAAVTTHSPQRELFPAPTARGRGIHRARACLHRSPRSPHQQIVHADAWFHGLLEGGAVADRLRVEDHDVGVRTFLQSFLPPCGGSGTFQHLRGHERHLAERFHQRERFLLPHILRQHTRLGTCVARIPQPEHHR